MKIRCLLLLGILHSLCFAMKYEGPSKKVLVYGGKTGWFGQIIVRHLNKLGHIPIAGTARLENRENLIKEVENTKPDVIINAAGITGRPHIDWCESHKI